METHLKKSSEMHKEFLQHCLKRIHNILNSGTYLNGNGEIETFLVQNINTDIRTASNDIESEEYIYHQMVKEAFTITFKHMSLIISRNDLSSDNGFFGTTRTYDDFQSKIEAWKTACFINEFFLNSDFSIIY